MLSWYEYGLLNNYNAYNDNSLKVNIERSKGTFKI